MSCSCFLLFIIFSLANSSPECTITSCSCVFKYNFDNITCVSLCPTGYSLTAGSCFISSSTNLFSLSFAHYWDFSQGSIGYFSLMPSSISGISTTPVFTKDRGLYFSNPSQISSSYSWILAPAFTLRFSARFSKDGDFFKVFSGSTSYLLVTVINSQLCTDILLTGTGTNARFLAKTYTEKLCNSIKYDTWHIIRIYSFPLPSSLFLYIDIKAQDLVSVNTIYYNMDYLPQVTSLKYKIGNFGSSFSGFLYEILLDNSFMITYSKSYNFIDCDFGQYFDYSLNLCKNCGSADGSALCTQDSGYCFDSNCASCTGFMYGLCSSCTDTLSTPTCGSTYFNSLSCADPLVLQSSICIYPPTFQNTAGTSPVVNIKFDNFTSLYGAAFQSGQNQTTFAPFNDPEADDPYPVKNRGLYFSGSQFLKTVNKTSLNIEFTIMFWSKSTCNCSILSSDYFTMYQNGTARMCFYDGSLLYCEYTYSSPGSTSGWVFIGFTLSYTQSSQTSTLKRIKSYSYTDTISVENYAFYNYPNYIIIGLGPEPFTGFIYQIYIWNVYISSMFSYYSSFCQGVTQACAYTASFDYYYNSYNAQFEPCDSTCIHGCVEWGRCDVCLKADCTQCSGFYSDCNSTQSITCFTGLKLTNNKHCCYPSCGECDGDRFNDCISCEPFKFLCEGTCIDSCPIGYSTSNNICAANLKKSLFVTFNAQLNGFVDTISGITFGPIGSGFWNFTEKDPIPAVDRGLYFNSSRNIKTQGFILPTSFMVTLFMKILDNGTIFSKGQSELSVNDTVYTLTNQYMKMYFNQAANTNWNLLILIINSPSSSNFQATLKLGSSSSSNSLTSYCFIDNVTNFTLGGSSSFKGFIYKMSIYNSVDLSIVNDYALSTCTNSGQLNCVSNCDFNYFLSGSNCTQCTGCPYGCYSSDFCNPCKSDHCLNCTGFGSNCLQCEDIYVLSSGSCICNSHYYLNHTTCYECDYNCLNCTGNSTNCTSCGMFSQLENGTCACQSTFVEDKNSSLLNFTCECQNHSALSNNTCICDNGYTMVNYTCVKCNERCVTCSGVNYNQCLSCVRILDSGICIDSCSLGYQLVNGVCVKSNSQYGIIKLKFDSLNLMKNDSISGIGVKYFGGKRRLQGTNQTSLLFRGLYFDGSSVYLKFPSSPMSTLMLNHDFSFSFWINPSKSTGVLLAETSGSALEILIKLVNQKFFVSLIISSTSYNYSSSNYISGNSWNTVVLSISYSTNTQLELVINNNKEKNSVFSLLPFEETPNSEISIGNYQKDYFSGFLYSFTVFNQNPSMAIVTSEAVLCSINNTLGCLSTCDINSYYDYDNKACFPCNSKCTMGCRSELSCSQCLDKYCLVCDSFYGSCIKCLQNYEINSTICVPCQSNQYYSTANLTCVTCQDGTYPAINSCVTCNVSQYFDTENKRCVDCKPLCKTCQSSNLCTSCIDNSILVNKSVCICKEGYDPTDNCSSVQVFYKAVASISTENHIKIKFSEAPSKNLTLQNFNLSVSGQPIQFNLANINSFTYQIIPSISDNTSMDSKVRISIVNGFKSVNGSTFMNCTIELKLFPIVDDDVLNLIAKAKEYARQGVTAGLSTVLGLSCISFDPTSFFSFVGTAELYYPISLFNSKLPVDSASFLGSLRVQSMLPNLFGYAISESSGSPIPNRYRYLGFRQSMMILNSGVNLSIGLFLLALAILTRFLSYFECIKSYVKSIRKMFEFGILMRFWVQSYVELSMSSLITIKFNTFSTDIERFDFFLGLAILILQIGGIVVLLYLIYKRKRVDEDEIEKFILSFGTIFNEFKEFGVSFWIYYLLFVLRRLFLVLFAVFVQEGMLQIMSCFCFSVLMFIYVFTTRCFKNILSNIHIIINEALFFSVSLVMLIHMIGGVFSEEEFSIHIMRILTAAWAQNILFGFSLLLYKIKNKLTKKKQAKVADHQMFRAGDHKKIFSESSKVDFINRSEHFSSPIDSLRSAEKQIESISSFHLENITQTDYPKIVQSQIEDSKMRKLESGFRRISKKYNSEFIEDLDLEDFTSPKSLITPARDKTARNKSSSNFFNNKFKDIGAPFASERFNTKIKGFDKFFKISNVQEPDEHQHIQMSLKGSRVNKKNNIIPSKYRVFKNRLEAFELKKKSVIKTEIQSRDRTVKKFRNSLSITPIIYYDLEEDSLKEDLNNSL